MFVTDLEAGPVALLLVGMIFLLIAMNGRLPSRLKFGDNEAAWEAVQEYVEATVDDAPLPERRDLLHRLHELAKNAPQATGPALEAVAYEQSVLEMLREIAHDVRPQITTESRSGAGSRFDAVITGPSSRQALVEIKLRANRSRSWYEGIYEQFLRHRSDFDSPTLLLITPDPIHSAGRALMAEHNDLMIVQVTGYEDLQILRQTVRDLVGPLDN
ncbi:hypothetical protein [Micromonospora sp. NPDC005171]|uniref:hypothetical protein n=1 Tax=Micromonospora sp. NPDC005171 TaxID=3156866 RepID=UPI0033B757CA